MHVMVADVIKSFDTVDRSILDCALGRLGLPDWFRKVFFSFHSQVRLRLKLAAGLGEPWCRDGGIPQGCPLSMIFIVASHGVVIWSRYLMSDLNFMLRILSAVLHVPELRLSLLTSLQGMSSLLVKMSLLVSVFFSAPPSRLGRP